MINWLDVRNFVLVEHVSLNFGRGMTVLTGETGAGKSIIVDALVHSAWRPHLRRYRPPRQRPRGDTGGV